MTKINWQNYLIFCHISYYCQLWHLGFSLIWNLSQAFKENLGPLPRMYEKPPPKRVQQNVDWRLNSKQTEQPTLDEKALKNEEDVESLIAFETVFIILKKSQWKGCAIALQSHYSVPDPNLCWFQRRREWGDMVGNEAGVRGNLEHCRWRCSVCRLCWLLGGNATLCSIERDTDLVLHQTKIITPIC